MNFPPIPRMRMRRLGATLALLCAAAAQAAIVTSSFDSGAEGWAAAGNGGGPLQWLADGGQPAGHLALSDASDGWAYFAAPAAWRVPMQAGAHLSFDLRSSSDDAHPIVSAVRVALVGAGLTLVAESVLPGPAWAHHEFLLGPGGGFRVLASAADLLEPWNRQPSADEWAHVLGSLNSFYISADYSGANLVRGGFETAELDNVRLEATQLQAVPEPGTLALCAAAWAAGYAARRRRAPPN